MNEVGTSIEGRKLKGQYLCILLDIVLTILIFCLTVRIHIMIRQSELNLDGKT